MFIDMGDNREDNGEFNINVYCPGNFFAKEITFNGPVNIGGRMESGGFSDEQIAIAITNINGDGKPLNSKRKWAAVHWYLRWACNFPPSPKDFCERVAKLPLKNLKYECDYDSIRHFSNLTFMDQDARMMDKVKPSKMDEQFFLQCREVVLALEKELGKAYLPQK